MISNHNIDAGKPFDWGKTSEDYARYRDIYPEEFYKKILDRGLCVKGQSVLDVGTGTGVLPRNMYRYGADWTGTDIAENQIRQAKILAEKAGMKIRFLTMPTERLDFDENIFDVITACQCFFYFDSKVVAEKLAKLLKKGGKLLVLYMAWLPAEDDIAGASEDMILKYNPSWSGCGEFRRPIDIPEEIRQYFEVVHEEIYDIPVSFTRESWHGRIRACRGIGASLQEEELSRWEEEHWRFLQENAPQQFDILHYVAMSELQVKK